MHYHQISAKHQVRFVWVKGNANNPNNNRCNELATAVADGKNLEADTGFVPSN